MNPICAQYEQGIGQKADLSGKLVRLFRGVVSSRFYTTTFLVGWVSLELELMQLSRVRDDGIGGEMNW